MAKKGKSGGPVVGLDIGSRWIKAVEIRPGKGGPVVTGIGYEPTPEGAVVEDAILDPTAVGNAIKQLFQSGGITANKVVSAVSGQSSVVVRIIEVPRMTQQELVETMKWEVERHIPFPSSEVVMDFKPLDRPSTPPDSQNMEVLLAVCQEDVVNKHITALTQAKLAPEAIEVEAVALPRSLIHGNADAEGYETVAIVDIGSETTKVCIYEKKILVFPRIVPIAGINLVRAISQAVGLEERQAEEALRESGVVDIELVNQLSSPGPVPDMGPSFTDGGDETQIGGFSPFGGLEAPDMPENLLSPSAGTAAPSVPAAGFDLGDEVLEAPSVMPDAPPDMPGAAGSSPTAETNVPFDLSGSFDSEPPVEPVGGVFDLGDHDQILTTSAPVFDLSDEEPPTPPTEAVPGDMGEQAAISHAIAPVLVELATELNRSLEYYASRNPSPVNAVIICGGPAKIPGLAGYLENILRVPVTVGDPLQQITINAKRYAPEFLSMVGPVFATSMGLALRNYVGNQ